MRKAPLSTVQPKFLSKRVAASAVKYDQQTVVVAAEVILVTADVDADKDMEGVMEGVTEEAA